MRSLSDLRSEGVLNEVRFETGSLHGIRLSCKQTYGLDLDLEVQRFICGANLKSSVSKGSVPAAFIRG